MAAEAVGRGEALAPAFYMTPASPSLGGSLETFELPRDSKRAGQFIGPA